MPQQSRYHVQESLISVLITPAALSSSNGVYLQTQTHTGLTVDASITGPVPSRRLITCDWKERFYLYGWISKDSIKW